MARLSMLLILASYSAMVIGADADPAWPVAVPAHPTSARAERLVRAKTIVESFRMPEILLEHASAVGRKVTWGAP
jgi:hypothetical protein